MDLAGVVNLLFQIVWLLILIDVIASWIPSLNQSEFLGQVRRITDPILEPFRRIVPPQTLGLDISPILAMVALRYIQSFIVGALR